MGGWKQLMLRICTIHFSRQHVSIQASASVPREIWVSYRLRVLSLVPLSVYMIVISYTLHWVRINPVQQVVLAWADAWRKVR